MEYTIKFPDPPNRVCDVKVISPESFPVDLIPELFPEHAYEERVFVLYFRQDLRLITYSMIGQGTVNCAVANVSKAIRDAVLCGSPRVMVIHNHPSGCEDFSRADKALAKKMADSFKLIDCSMVDFLLWTGDRIISYTVKYGGLN